jgi:formylglycine-generating enzyme required for sulfatase activity
VTRPAFWNELAVSASDLAIVWVSWHEAEAYCRWRSARLPTEAE